MSSLLHQHMWDMYQIKCRKVVCVCVCVCIPNMYKFPKKSTILEMGLKRSNSPAKKVSGLKKEEVRASFWTFYRTHFLFEHQHQFNVFLHVIGTILSVFYMINFLSMLFMIIPRVEEYETSWNKVNYEDICSTFITLDILRTQLLVSSGENRMVQTSLLSVSLLEFFIAFLMYPGKELILYLFIFFLLIYFFIQKKICK